MAHEGARVLLAEQVRSPRGTEEQRAPGEDGRGRGTGVGDRLHGVGEVGEGVARGRDGTHAHRRRDLDDVPIANGLTVEGDLVLSVDVVPRAEAASEGQTPGHVVVVEVGLEDVGDSHAGLLSDREHTVDVSLWVDDEGDVAVVGEVGTVAQARGLDGHDRGFHG